MCDLKVKTILVKEIFIFVSTIEFSGATISDEGSETEIGVESDADDREISC